MRVAVQHVTRLEFAGEVTESVMDVRLGPFDDADQRTQRFQLRWEPHGHVRRYEDGFGNVAYLLTSMRTHAFVQVSTDSEVDTLLGDPFELPAHVPQPLSPLELADGLNPSPLVPSVPVLSELAEAFRHLEPFDAARQMSAMINEKFEYQPGVTDVTSSVAEVAAGGRGVCQDFAHLLIGLCRSLRIPARYVSGYIVTADVGGPSRGGGASHAWTEAFTPTHGWRGFDPTNNLLANDRYIKVAVGRDYHDVPPTRGTYRGAGVGNLGVAVSTHVLD
jgi:transglutaminase-like putative cysteine protease